MLTATDDTKHDTSSTTATTTATVADSAETFDVVLRFGDPELCWTHARTSVLNSVVVYLIVPAIAEIVFEYADDMPIRYCSPYCMQPDACDGCDLAFDIRRHSHSTGTSTHGASAMTLFNMQPIAVCRDAMLVGAGSTVTSLSGFRHLLCGTARQFHAHMGTSAVGSYARLLHDDSDYPVLGSTLWKQRIALSSSNSGR
jgi:hypothetical protein